MPQASFTNGYALLIGVNDNLIPNYALPTVAKDAAAAIVEHITGKPADPQKIAAALANAKA